MLLTILLCVCASVNNIRALKLSFGSGDTGNQSGFYVKPNKPEDVIYVNGGKRYILHGTTYSTHTYLYYSSTSHTVSNDVCPPRRIDDLEGDDY